MGYTLTGSGLTIEDVGNVWPKKGKVESTRKLRNKVWRKMVCGKKI